jgi:hypothetical protein
MAIGNDGLPAVADVGNTLVLASRDAPVTDAVAASLLERGANPALLCVQFTSPVDQWVDNWRSRVGTLPEETVVVTADGSGRERTDSGDVRVRSVASPADFTGMGMGISEAFADWDEADRDVTFYLESLGVVLEYSDLRTLYRFLHVLTARVDAVDGRAQYVVDPATVPDRNVEVLKTLMDGAVVRDDDWRLQTG